MLLQGLLIDPAAHTISPAQVERGSLDDIYALVGASPITVAHLDDVGTGVYVDDEGLFKTPQSFFFHEPTGQFLAGKGLVLGCDEMGESTSCPIPIEQLRREVDFGTPVRMNGVLMFIGDRNVREIR